MDITLTPDIYTPSVDSVGNYIDNIPMIRHGIICPCGSRKDKAYENASKFAVHIKTKAHQKWLIILNQNKANYYVEMMKSKEVVENQRKLIAQLENQLQKSLLTINLLSEQLHHIKTNNNFLNNLSQPETINLLDIN